MSRRHSEATDGLTVRPGGEAGVKLFGVTLSRGDSAWRVEEPLGSRSDAGDVFRDGSQAHLTGVSRQPRSPFANQPGSPLARQPGSPSACPPAPSRETREGRLLVRAPSPSGIAGRGRQPGIPAVASLLDTDASSRQELGRPAGDQGVVTWGKGASVCRPPGLRGMQGLGRKSEAGEGSGVLREADETKMLLSTETMREHGGEDFSDNDSLRELEASASKERKKGVPWTAEEHRLFLLGLQELGKGDWRGISRKFVLTRTPTQVASHAQKYFIRQANQNKRKRRASLLDIGTESLASDSAMPRSVSSPALPTQCDRGRPGAITAVPCSINPLPRSPLSGGTLCRDDAKEPSDHVECRASLQCPKSAPCFPSSLPAAVPPRRPDSPPPSDPERQSMYGHASSHSQETRFACAPPNMDISRTRSYPSVRAEGANQEVPVGLARPDSMPLIGSHRPGAIPTASPHDSNRLALHSGSNSGAAYCAKFLDGLGSSSGTLDADAAAAAWTTLHECIKAASSGSSGPATTAPSPPMATMDPASKHRLGHDMIAEIMSRQFGQPCSSGSASLTAWTPTSTARPAFPWTPGALEHMQLEAQGRREATTGSASECNDIGAIARVASCSLSGKLANVSTAAQLTPIAQAAWSLAASQSLSHTAPMPPLCVTSPSGNPTAANSSVAGADAAAPAATSTPPEAGAWDSQSIHSWRSPSGAWLPRQLLTPPPDWTTAGKPFSFPPAHVPSAAAHEVGGISADTYSGEAPEVLWPHTVLPSAAHAMPGVWLGAASRTAEQRASGGEHGGTLMLLGEAIGRAKEGPASGAATGEVNEGVQRDPPITLQLFDASQKPSAFQPSARVSPDPADVSQTPISVP